MARDTYIDRKKKAARETPRSALTRREQVYLFAVSQVVPHVHSKMEAQRANGRDDGQEPWTETRADVLKPKK